LLIRNLSLFLPATKTKNSEKDGYFSVLVQPAICQRVTHDNSAT